MASLTQKNLSFNNAEQFKESFFEPEPATIGYVFLGNHIEWAIASTPDTPVDTTSYEKTIWDNMYAAKKITGNDLSFVIPKVSWTGNTKYRQFDDTIDFGTLLTANTTQNLKPMYVITSANNVYKCLSNNFSANSTIEPSGDYSSSNGTVSTADGFIWKYMFKVKSSNKFLNTNWIPCPISTSALDYAVSNTGVVSGQITTIVTTNSGTNYTTTVLQPTAFLSNVSVITLPNLINVVANMSITGNGIATGTYITSVNATTTTINLSFVTSSNAGGSGNNITISPRVYISGDGVGAVANANIVSNTIVSINLTSFGSNYTRANVFVYGSGSNFAGRVIIPPKDGHAYNPAKELNANNVMVAVRIGTLDSTEGGLISSNTSFRQFGLLRNPYKYGQSVAANTSTANSVISQTTNLTVVAGSSYYINEFVYQGASVANSTFSGYLQEESSNTLKLTRVKGVPIIGSPVIGQTSSTSRSLVSKNDPEFQPYTGEILYIENIEKVDRADGQAENIKFVVKF